MGNRYKSEMRWNASLSAINLGLQKFISTVLNRNPR